MDEFEIKLLIFSLIAFASGLKARSWKKKRRIQAMIEDMENIDELKQLALVTNTIGWVAGGKFGNDAEKYYYFAITGLNNFPDILNKLPTYSKDNIKTSAFDAYKLLKIEMKERFTEEEIEYSQTWAALKILDLKNYMNGRSKEDIDAGSSYFWA